MIAAVIERCAGIDVGKKLIAVCVMTGPASGEAQSGAKRPDVCHGIRQLLTPCSIALMIWAVTRA
jgi:hypothetical protein